MTNADPGRPESSDELLETWLEEMKPFLKLGETLHAAIHDAGLMKHQKTIYNKYREKDWFLQRVDAWRATPGKMAHNILSRMIGDISEKQKQDKAITDEEMRNVRFYAEKSRSAQPYFVNRTETAEAKPIEELLDELDTEDDVAAEITKQVVATESPVQDQKQAGLDGHVPSQPNAASVQS